MRNRIVHGYFGVDLGAIWRTSAEDVEPLARAIRASGQV
ncbi:MAG: HepT-like ribonuclease domain-containing protein [Caulobacterales bacterium]